MAAPTACPARTPCPWANGSETACALGGSGSCSSPATPWATSRWPSTRPSASAFSARPRSKEMRGPAKRSHSSAFPTVSTPVPNCCPGESGNVWRSPAPSPPGRGSSSRMSPPATSTRSTVGSSSTICEPCTPRARPSCSSPTTPRSPGRPTARCASRTVESPSSPDIARRHPRARTWPGRGMAGPLRAPPDGIGRHGPRPCWTTWWRPSRPCPRVFCVRCCSWQRSRWASAGWWPRWD